MTPLLLPHSRQPFQWLSPIDKDLFSIRLLIADGSIRQLFKKFTCLFSIVFSSNLNQVSLNYLKKRRFLTFQISCVMEMIGVRPLDVNGAYTNQ